MKTQTHSMTGGIVMLASLVAMMAIPMAIGYFTLSPLVQPSLHAEASAHP